MKPTAVILYGPPASGKDTVTGELIRQDSRYVAHRRLKVGNGNGATYRMSTLNELEAFRASGQVLYENERYGNTYAFITSHLEEDLERGVPVLHVGYLVGVRALKTYPIRWLSVALWCERETTRERAQSRGSSDVDRRLVAWDETRADFTRRRSCDFDAVLDTETLSVEAQGQQIRQLFRQWQR